MSRREVERIRGNNAVAGGKKEGLDVNGIDAEYDAIHHKSIVLIKQRSAKHDLSASEEIEYGPIDE